MGNKPLGYVSTAKGKQPVYAMHDLFLNYMFKMEENFEILREILNIFSEKYIETLEGKSTNIRRLTGTLEVETQYEYLLDLEKSKPRSQDVRITERDADGGVRIEFVEFQNEAHPSMPIKNRGIGYYGLGVGLNPEATVNQRWIIAEYRSELMHGYAIQNYRLVSECSGHMYPNDSSIIFVCLSMLAKGNGISSELSRFLLGEQESSTNPVIQRIIAAFSKTFSDFKNDKEVVQKMTQREELIAFGEARGEARGEIKGKIETLFVEVGLAPESIAKKINKSEQYVRDVLANGGFLKM